MAGWEATGADYNRKAAALEKKEKGLRAYDKANGTNRLGEHHKEEARKLQETKRAYYAKQNKPPVTQNSPTTVNVPGWRVVVLGSSGGISVRGYYRDNA